MSSADQNPPRPSGKQPLATDPTSAAWPSDVVTPDARSLRGLAHPLRLQLLGMLRLEGPATATQLAARTGQSSGATSYHLRQLAAYGFVVEDAARSAGKRDRYWRAAHRLTVFDQPASADEGERALGEEYLRIVADANARRTQAAIAGLATLEQDLGAGWMDAFTISDLSLRLTRDEARALIAELEDIARRYRPDDPEERRDGPVDMQRVILQFQVLPERTPSHD